MQSNCFLIIDTKCEYPAAGVLVVDFAPRSDTSSMISSWSDLCSRVRLRQSCFLCPSWSQWKIEPLCLDCLSFPRICIKLVLVVLSVVLSHLSLSLSLSGARSPSSAKRLSVILSWAGWCESFLGPVCTWWVCPHPQRNRSRCPCLAFHVGWVLSSWDPQLMILHWFRTSRWQDPECLQWIARVVRETVQFIQESLV